MPPRAASKKRKAGSSAGAAQKRRRVVPGDKKRSRKPRTDSYKTYVYRVLKQVHPDTGATKKSMKVMDAFTHDTLDRIAHEAFVISAKEKRKTVTARDIQSAVRFVLPGELQKHAVAEATKALAKYNAS